MGAGGGAVLLVSFFVLVVSCSASASCQHRNTSNTVISWWLHSTSVYGNRTVSSTMTWWLSDHFTNSRYLPVPACAVTKRQYSLPNYTVQTGGPILEVCGWKLMFCWIWQRKLTTLFSYLNLSASNCSTPPPCSVTEHQTLLRCCFHRFLLLQHKDKWQTNASNGIVDSQKSIVKWLADILKWM